MLSERAKMQSWNFCSALLRTGCGTCARLSRCACCCGALRARRRKGDCRARVRFYETTGRRRVSSKTKRAAMQQTSLLLPSRRPGQRSDLRFGIGSSGEKYFTTQKRFFFLFVNVIFCTKRGDRIRRRRRRPEDRTAEPRLKGTSWDQDLPPGRARGTGEGLGKAGGDAQNSVH